MITIEEAKKELSEYKQNVKYIEEKQNDALELRTRLESMTRRLTGIPSGKGENLERSMLEESIDKIDNIIAECDKKLQELLIKKFIVENKIDSLEQPYKTILYTIYIRAKKFRIVAEEMGYEYKYFCSLHGDALQKYSQL